MGGGVDPELLFSSGVLRARDDDVSLSEPFDESIGEYQTQIAGLSTAELRDLIGGRIAREPAVEAFVELGERDPRSVAELCALDDFVPTSTPEGWLPLLPVLRLFRRESVPTEGVPEPFIPVPGDHLPYLLRVYPRVLVYIWLDDCVPCDAVKDRLESIFVRPEGLLLFAVYGPEYTEVLRREYDVNAGPALLFMRDGKVDTRLYGAHGERVIKIEADKLREP